MAHRLVVLEWLYKADQDFGFAKDSLEKENLPYFDQICWLLHQAAEKYLKAYIVRFDLEFRKEHDLEKLLEICMTHDVDLDKLKEGCRLLTPFYFETRYPGESRRVSRKEAELMLEETRGIQSLVREKLGIEGEVSQEDLEEEDKKVEEELE